MRQSSLVVARSKPAQPRFSEPAPIAPHTAGLRRVGPSRENLKTPPKDVRQAMQDDKELSAAEEYNRVIQAKLNLFEAEDDEFDPRISVSTQTQQRTSIVKGVNNRLPAVAAPRSVIPLSALFFLLLSFLANFKLNSASLGYCDSNSNTNNLILARHRALDDANACIDRRTHLDLETPGAGKSMNCDVSALPLVPFLPTPVHCAVCPQHAICDVGKVIACEPEYLLSSHPFSVLSPVVDGLPGLGPRVLPPSCRPDTAKKRLIGGLAKEMEQTLAKGRGRVVCAGMGKADGRKGLGERFGTEQSILGEQFSARRDVSTIDKGVY